MRAWAEMFNAFLDAHRPHAAVHRRGLLRRTSTASPGTTASGPSWSSRGIELPEGDPADAPDAETVCGLGNRKNDAFDAGARARRRRAPTPARVRAARRSCASAACRWRSSRPRATRPTVLGGGRPDRPLPDRRRRRRRRRARLAGKPAPDTFLHAAERARRRPRRARSCSRTRVSGVAGRRAPATSGWSSASTAAPAPTTLTEAGADVVVADLARAAVSDRRAAPEARRTRPRRSRTRCDRTRFPVDAWRLVETRFDERRPRHHRDAVRRRQRLPRHARQRRGGPRLRTRTAPSSTASTRPGRSSTPRRRSASRAIGQTIVNAPDAKVIRLYVDDEPLLLPIADLLDYERGARLPHRRAAPASSCGAPRRQAGAGRSAPGWSR